LLTVQELAQENLVTHMRQNKNWTSQIQHQCSAKTTYCLKKHWK